MPFAPVIANATTPKGARNRHIALVNMLGEYLPHEEPTEYRDRQSAAADRPEQRELADTGRWKSPRRTVGRQQEAADTGECRHERDVDNLRQQPHPGRNGHGDRRRASCDDAHQPGD